MSVHMLQALASQHLVERRSDVGAQHWQHVGGPSRAPLRVRAGWTLIAVGLRLVVTGRSAILVASGRVP
jgi:hypothetical protein